MNIDAGNRAVALMTAEVRSTYTPAVLAGIGAFGGLFDASVLKTLTRPVLVASTDGVGTKVKLAARANRYQAIGQDIVNHCINDILVQGARPLFFPGLFCHLIPQAGSDRGNRGRHGSRLPGSRLCVVGGRDGRNAGSLRARRIRRRRDDRRTGGIRAHPPAVGYPGRRFAGRPALFRAAYQRLFADPADFR